MRRNVHPLLLLVTGLLGCATTSAPATCDSRVKLGNIWSTIQARHDQNGDGRITTDEFRRGAKQFQNHDRDGDGVLTIADFPADRHWNGFGPRFASAADADKNKVVTAAEWQAHLDRLDRDSDGTMTMAELADVFPPYVTKKPDLIRLSFDQNGNGRLDRADFASLYGDLDFNGDGQLAGRELESSQFLGTRHGKRKPPQVGEVAPEFDLPLVDRPDETVALASFRGKRPVALIFGSYT